MKQKALAGIRILEYAQLVCGPYCGKLFADLGAEVIKIEDPLGGEMARRRGPFVGDHPDPENSILFMYLNTNKSGITLDLKDRGGIDTFKRLVKDADILIEDKSPQTTAELGINYEILTEINPRLIVTSITPFGQDGPYAAYKSYSLNTTFSGGLGCFTSNVPNGTVLEPVKHGGMVGEYACGLQAATATLAALYAQRITGLGQHVDVSKQEAIVGINRVPAAHHINAMRSIVPAGYTARAIDPLVRCKDGYVVIMLIEKHQWQALVRLMGNPQWARNELYNDGAERKARYGTEIKPHLEQWAMQYTKDEIYHQAQARGCPVGPVLTAEDITRSAQLHARQFFVQVGDASRATFTYPGAPYKLSNALWSLQRPAPTLGQHNPEVIDSQHNPCKAHNSEIPTEPSKHQMIKYPLEGIRIIDFTWAWAGAHATALLAMLGAEVIKVESRSRIDLSRISSITTGEFYEDIELSPAFNDMNLNKLGITLNLRHPKGVELAKKLVKISDVAAQNMRPGVVDRLGLGYEVLQQIKPDLIMLSSSALGMTGPHHEYVGYASNFAAIGGLTHMTGHPDNPPALSGGEVDLLSAVTSAHAVLTALFYRKQTGEGQHIDLSSSEAVSVLLGDVLMDYSVNGRVQSRRGNRDEIMAPHNCYPCRDENQWISIAIGTEQEWRAFCGVTGHREWLDDMRFADQHSRWQNQGHLDQLIRKWTVEYTHYEAMGILQEAGIAAIPFFRSEDLCTDLHLKHRNYWVEVNHPAIGWQMVAGPPWKLSRTPAEVIRHGPLLGEHNDYVFGELLGLDATEITTLMQDQVIY